MTDATPEEQPQTSPEDAATTQGEESKTEAPPWGDDFDPARAWEKIQKANAEAKNLRTRVITDEQKQKLAEYDRLVEASKSELERAQEERDRWQREAQQWRSTTVTSRIEALAAQDFAFPADAVTKLSENNYLDAGGVIDDAAIKRDLAAILEERPNWRRQTEAPKPRVPAPNQDQGSGGGGRPSNDPRQEFAAILGQHLK